MLCIFHTVILEPNECDVYHKNLIVICTIFTSDVKTVFLSKTGNCFVKIVFLPATGLRDVTSRV